MDLEVRAELTYDSSVFSLKELSQQAKSLSGAYCRRSRLARPHDKPSNDQATKDLNFT